MTNESGAAGNPAPDDATDTNTCRQATHAIGVIASDPRRRIRLHHVLRRRRRWSRELDRLCGVERDRAGRALLEVA